MKYHRTPIEVDAVQMTVDFMFGQESHRAGDYLVTFADGRQEVFGKERFEAEYAEGAFQSSPVRVADEFIRRNVGYAMTIPRPEDFDRDEQQTSTGVCFTCGEDVRVSQMDALKNCPACASKYILKPAAESMPVTTQDNANGPRIVLCPACGGPGPAERMNENGCFRCDPGLMAEAMAAVGG